MHDDESTTDLLSRLPGMDMDDVAIRRLRQRILDAAASEVVPMPAASRRARRTLGVSVALVLAVAGAVTLWPSRHPSDQHRSFVADVFTTSGTAARWSRRVSEGTERIELMEGRFHLRIRDHGPETHVVVDVPDGRIEDLGTIFDVVVSEARTTRVVVEEGSVILYLSGAPATLLTTGHLWESAAGMTAARVPMSDRRLNDAPPPSSSARTSGPRSKHHLDSAPLGRSDLQAEDNAYLNAIRLLRANRRSEARSAARDYLQKFPNGFRREEMGAIK
jgi:hypothetical protein